MVWSADRRGVAWVVLVVAAVAGSSAANAAPFPDMRPATRGDAAALLCPGPGPEGPCVRSRLAELTPESRFGAPALRRAISMLRSVELPESTDFPGPDEMRIVYSTADGRVDRADPADGSRNGVPDVVEGVALGAWQARGLLMRQLELSRPPVKDVILVELGDRLDGYLVSSGPHSYTLVLDATPADGAEGARRAAIRLYGYAAARGSASGFPVRWAEAVASWTLLSIDGAPDPPTTYELSERTRRLHAGLDASDPTLAAGNALWLSFVEDAYGLGSVRATIEDLGRSFSVPAALDLGLRRSSRDDLHDALREFHLWSVLVGDRADGNHFPFAARLESPAFASTADGLPAIAIREAPAVAPLGASHVLLALDEAWGGAHVRFEGDMLASWEADLLLVGENGGLRRIPVRVGADGRGEVTVPVAGVQEAMLLVRNLESADGEPHRYSVTAFHEPSFPFELLSLDADRAASAPGGILVSWETATEDSLVGFNVLRAEVGSGREVVVNPVWIPPMGDRTEPAAYRFLDRTADPTLAYSYRIEGITSDGIPAASRSVQGPLPTP